MNDDDTTKRYKLRKFYKKRKKYYVCKKIRLMVFLQKKGFNFIKIQEDRNDHDRVVWIFIETPELRDAIEEYYSRKEFLNRNKNRNT